MRIAVACLEASLLSPVAPCVGQAPWFMLFDSQTGCWESCAHFAADPTPHLSGVRAAGLLQRARAEAVLAGDFGAASARVLHEAHICLARARHMTAAQAVVGFLDGTLVDC